MTYPTFRRRRRRRTLVAVAVVGMISVLALAVALARSDRQASREYLDAAFDVAAGTEDLAGGFIDLVTHLDEMERPRVIDDLELLVAESGVLVEELGRAEAPTGGDLYRADTFFTIATKAWRDGLFGFSQAILILSEDALDDAGRAQLVSALGDLRLGDAAYQEFRAAINVTPEAGTLAEPFPPVLFVPADQVEEFTVDSITRKMLQAPGLGTITNLAIADIKLEPSPTGERNGIPVIPVSETLEAQATVSNRGTVPVDTISVTLTMVSNEGETYEVTQGIERLEPGDLTLVTFGTLPVEGGRLYEVAISLDGTDDDPTDDRVTFQFLRNEDA